MLAAGRHPFWLSLFIIMVTGAVYASFYLLSSMHLAYPHWVAYGILDKAPYIFALYNLLFVGRALWALVRRKGMVLT
jgi:hypothetical protein